MFGLINSCIDVGISSIFLYKSFAVEFSFSVDNILANSICSSIVIVFPSITILSFIPLFIFSVIVFIFVVFITNPLWMLSVKSDNLLGVIIDNIALSIARRN